MKTALHIALLLLSAIPAAGHNREVALKLREVDATLAKKAEYDARKEERIGNLRSALRDAVDDTGRWESTYYLYQEYSSYKYDSAYAYALKLGDIAARVGITDLKAQAVISKVYCLINAGLFKEAFDEIKAVTPAGLSPRALLEYYRVMVRLNYSARGYALTDPYWDEYSKAGEYYSRKILESVPENTRTWHEYNANLLMESRQFDEGIREFTALLADPDLDLHSRAIYASSMGWMQQCQGLEDEALISICESAICDVKSSTKETTALRMLADNLSRRGEVERPSRYVRESFDDANFYNARLRKLEVGAVLPLVEKNHYESLWKEKTLLAVSTVLVLVIAIAAIAALWFFRRQNRRLHEARQAIEERNRQLEDANARLAEANAIKVEYIGNSFYINSEFIEKMSQLYKMVDRMIVTRQYDEIRRSLKESTLDKERDSMYESFDTTFLKIFPTFVNDYNALFPESEQVFPAHGLNPEMRIFALIRLGISETDRIARFLDYSVHTINTYKTKVKNKSWVDNDKFESEIMQIGK
ncbi:MAG: helix-turn-helix transcriptional regulator [Bacteroidales bacterium]|nr:helix-turn-helix transcriptional regulator [Bacteroidales bacterium]